jgi:hypothetical protein
VIDRSQEETIMQQQPFRRLAAAALALALVPAGAALAAAVLVAGCSGGSGDALPEGAATEATAEATTGESPPKTSSGQPRQAELATVLGDDTPLGEYRKYMNGPAFDFDQQLEALVEANDERQQLVAACMKDAGFDYTPVPYSGPREQEPHPGYQRAEFLLVPPLDPDRDNVAEWGYGLDPEPVELAEGELPEAVTGPGADPEAFKVSQENRARRDALSLADQREYDLALAGPVDGEGHPLDPDGGGCWAGARAQVPDVPALPSANGTFTAAHEDLIIEMVDVTSWAIGMDPRSLALDQEWERCAAAKGVDFSSVQYDYHGHVATDASMRNRPSPVVALVIARGLDEDGNRVDPADEDTPTALRAYPAQVEVALIDFDCRKQVDYMDRMMAIVVDVEQRFVDANKDRLEAMKADAAQGG